MASVVVQWVICSRLGSFGVVIVRGIIIVSLGRVVIVSSRNVVLHFQLVLFVMRVVDVWIERVTVVGLSVLGIELLHTSLYVDGVEDEERPVHVISSRL